MIERFPHPVEVLVLAGGIYAVLRFLGQTRGSGVIRGLALVLIGGIFGFTILAVLLLVVVWGHEPVHAALVVLAVPLGAGLARPIAHGASPVARAASRGFLPCLSEG